MYYIIAADYFSYCSYWSTSFSGVRKQVTEYGSITSTNSHLAGSRDVASEQVVQEFCIKTSDVDDDSEEEDDSEEKEMNTDFVDFMEGTICFILLLNH